MGAAGSLEWTNSRKFRISVFFVALRVTRTPARKNYIRNPQFCTLGHQIPFLLKKRVRKPYTNSRQLDVFANFTAGILQKPHRHPDMKRITTGNQLSWGQMDQRRVVFLRSACLTRVPATTSRSCKPGISRIGPSRWSPFSSRCCSPTTRRNKASWTLASMRVPS